jgi:hypothetical protein
VARRVIYLFIFGCRGEAKAFLKKYGSLKLENNHFKVASKVFSTTF